jgi:hypothetical protein
MKVLVKAMLGHKTRELVSFFEVFKEFVTYPQYYESRVSYSEKDAKQKAHLYRCAFCIILLLK